MKTNFLTVLKCSPFQFLHGSETARTSSYTLYYWLQSIPVLIVTAQNVTFHFTGIIQVDLKFAKDVNSSVTFSVPFCAVQVDSGISWWRLVRVSSLFRFYIPPRSSGPPPLVRVLRQRRPRAADAPLQNPESGRKFLTERWKIRLKRP